MVGNPFRYDLASSVRDALAFHARTSRERIVTFNNANKYSASDGVNHDGEALPEIFELMWQLNRDGLADDSLGSATHASGSSRDSLAKLTFTLRGAPNVDSRTPDSHYRWFRHVGNGRPLQAPA